MAPKGKAKAADEVVVSGSKRRLPESAAVADPPPAARRRLLTKTGAAAPVTAQPAELEAIATATTAAAEVPKPGAMEPPSQEVLALLSRICDVDMMQRHLFEMGYDAFKVPVGRVSRDMVREGHTWLKAIEGELYKVEPKATALASLSTKFYSIIPHTPAAGEGVVIDAMQVLRERLAVVDALADVEVAQVGARLLRDAGSDGAAVGADALEKCYRRLKCSLTPLARSSETWQLIETYARPCSGANAGTTTEEAGSSGSLRIREIFAVERPTDLPRFARHSKNTNRALLWHGLPRSSAMGVLSQGLRPAPKEAPDRAYAFGKGIYFSDAAMWAARRCGGGPGPVFLLLVEVALGRSHPLPPTGAGEALSKRPGRPGGGLPQGFQSALVAGARVPDPSRECVLPDGVRVPLGPGVARPLAETAGAPPCNEFVVYDHGQVRLRYLVEAEIEG